MVGNERDAIVSAQFSPPDGTAADELISTSLAEGPWNGMDMIIEEALCLDRPFQEAVMQICPKF